MSRLLAITLAVFFHAGVVLFGGLIVGHARESAKKTQEVELLGPEATKEDKKLEPEPEKPPEELEAEEEPVPDASEVVANLDTPDSNDAPALDAASLGAIEQALNGTGGGGDFAQELSFASGGRIGGTGRAGDTEQKLESAFSLSEIDQKPNAISKTLPMYPSELRSKKLEGVVNVIFVVDSSGKVTNPRIESSSNPAFEKPALDAVKQWRFEPAVKAGQRVGCKMRAPIRFQPNA